MGLVSDICNAGCTEIFLQKLHDTPLSSGAFFGIL